MTLTDLTTPARFEAYYFDGSDEDQRAPHRKQPNEPVAYDVVAKLGVRFWNLAEADVNDPEGSASLSAIRAKHDYPVSGVMTQSPEALGDAYLDTIKTQFKEHIHPEDEARFILDGEAYWDVRDFEERWIRIKVQKGDVIVLPEGIYHRFTTTETNYAKIYRLRGPSKDPWVALPRTETDKDHASRLAYLQSVAAVAV